MLYKALDEYNVKLIVILQFCAYIFTFVDTNLKSISYCRWPLNNGVIKHDKTYLSCIYFQSLTHDLNDIYFNSFHK